MSAASLVVRISADINSFSREMNKMTKDVDKAAKKLTELGQGLTLGLTLPITLAAVALSKMGIENEAVAGKMTREFGPAVERVNGLLTKLMTVVPETMTEMQKMALATNDFGRGLGMAAPQAEALSESMMKMAADISSKKMIDFKGALELVQKGLAGQTRGLKSAGIVIDAAQVKQEAYRLGLLKIGHELTPLGTALATYSLMTKQMAQSQGDAAASWNDTGRQLAFAKRDLMEFFDATSNLMIPALRLLAKVLTGVVNALNALPDWVRQTILVFGGMLAVLGPTIIIVAKVTQAIMALRAAVALLSTGSLLAKIIGALAAPEILAVLAAVAIAIGIAIALWKKYHKETSTKAPDLGPLANVKDLMGGITSQNNDSPLQKLQKDSKEVISFVTDLIAMSEGPLQGAFKSITDLNVQSLHLYDAQKDKLGEMAQAARQVAKETQAILASLGVMETFSFGNSGLFSQQQHMQRAVGVGSRQTTTDNQLKFNIASQMIGDETSLRMREMMLTLPPVFNAVRLAAVDLGEQFRKAHQDLAVSFARFKSQYSSPGSIASSAGAGASAGLAGIMDSLGPFALAMTAVGKIFQGFQPVLDNLLGPLVALGQIIGTMITPILRILFIPLKYLGIIVAFLGEILARVSAAIATAIGNVLIGIGKALNAIPFLHLGSGIEAAGNALKGFAADQYTAADQLKKQRQQLQALDFDSASNGLNNLASSANSASESLTNASQTFKLNLAKYNARDFDRTPLNLSGAAYGTPDAASTSSAMSTPDAISSLLSGDAPVANLTLDGKVVAQVTVDHIRTAAARQYGDASRIKDVVVVGR